MKKILYLVTQSDFGGAQVYVYNLASNLSNEYEIVVAGGVQGEKGELAKRLNEPAWPDCASRTGRKNIRYVFLPNLIRAINPIKDFLALFEIVNLIKKENPDIIHLNSSKISILGSIASLITNSSFLNLNSKIIYTVHGWVFNEPMSKLKKLFYKYAEKFTSILKDKLICVSEFDKHIAIKNNICNPKKLVTIHNGIKKLDFLSKQEARQKLVNLVPSPVLREGQGEVIIGTIANLYKTKGLEYLIKAIHILSNLDFKLSTIIIGEGPERPYLEKLIKDYKLENNVYLLGNIKNTSLYLKAFDIYVCSSVKEGFPFSILEAMQAGLPIVSTRVGGIPEMLINNETGLLVEPKNSEALAKAIEKLINNKELKVKTHCMRLGKNAKEKVLNDFNLNTFIKKTKNIYNV